MSDLSTTFLLFVTTAICLLIGVIYVSLKKRYKYWSDLGIPGPKPTFIIGNMKESLLLKCTEPTMVDSWYNDYQNEPYIGFYNLLKPSVLIIDPELVGKVTEVDFNHFVDHPSFSGDSNHDAIGNSLFSMKGENWKLKRSIFSKLFTPKRLREHAETFNQRYSLLKEEIEKQLEISEDIDISKLVGRYILTNVISIMYGIDQTTNEGLLEDLEKYTDMFLRPSVPTALKFLFYATFPDLFTLLKMKTFPLDFWNYFSPFTKQLLESRRRETTNRIDVVTLISQHQGCDTSKAIDDREAVGHIFSFLSASHDTTLTTLSYVLFMLAQHPEVQEKIRDEVERAQNGTDKMTYDTVKDMDYLEAVINETMRFYPLLGILKRVCTEEYHVDEKLTIPEGMDVFIPVQAINMNPEYYQEPEKFHPERFLGQDKLPSFFMPFGKGPRICIGLRMATISMKIAVARIVSDYIILPSPNTTLPVKYDVRSLFITCRPENGLWVRFQKRDPQLY